MSMNIGSHIVSKLGSPDSRIPLAAKDIFNSAGYTYFSYDAGGEVEGKDRLVDEIGTGLIWLFGIPTYNKFIDKTLFKKAGISPNIDIRVLKNNDYYKQALKHAPNKQILNELKIAGSNINKTKILTISKFILSLSLTMLSYFGLTKAKQYMTKKNIEKEFYNKKDKESNTINPNNIYLKENKTFSEFTKQNKQVPTFGSSALIKTAEEFILNPVKNMLILDMGISGERLANARTKTEFSEYAIKEGSFLFFIYGADKVIKKGIEKLSEKLFKAPIKLDAKFLSSNLAEKILQNKDYQKQIIDFKKQISKSNSKQSQIYDFIFSNPNNTVVEAAKKSGIISTVKDLNGNTKIDTGKFIDLEKMKNLADDLNSFIKAGKNSKNSTSYLKKVKLLKVSSTFLNVAICCLSLGYIVPKMMYEYRKNSQNGDTNFHVRTEYEKELASKNIH